jgi:hypothetical protein
MGGGVDTTIAARRGPGLAGSTLSTTIPDPNAPGHTQLLAPPPTLLGGPTPPDATLAASNAVVSANAAALKQRKRLTFNPSGPTSSIAAPSPMLLPKTLLGY